MLTQRQDETIQKIADIFFRARGKQTRREFCKQHNWKESMLAGIENGIVLPSVKKLINMLAIIGYQIKIEKIYLQVNKKKEEELKKLA